MRANVRHKDAEMVMAIVQGHMWNTPQGPDGQSHPAHNPTTDGAQSYEGPLVSPFSPAEICHELL